jgi:hypothetical protein
MAEIDTHPYLKYILYASLEPAAPKENIIYAVICEFLLQHKIPSDRFVLYPQISLPWKPGNQQDRRAEVPDFCLGHFMLQAPYFKLRIGVEAKRRLRDIMAGLPEPSTIDHNRSVMAAFHALYYQGEDQAKAAVKGGQTLYGVSGTLPYLLFVGPYWTFVQYGPFAGNELEIRTHKASNSGEYTDKFDAAIRLAAPPSWRRLYLLGTAESYQQLESIISSTDGAANNLIAQARNYTCM